MKVASLLLGFVAATSGAQTLQAIKVIRPAWEGLTPSERSTIQGRYLVDLRASEDFGIIIDNQGIDESSSGTSGGAIIGGALAQTVYIDRALRGGNYSATTQLALGLLGAIAGSSVDRPAIRQFHYRYALRTSNGEIQYRDSIQGDAFRHPVGMCLELAKMIPAPQTMCAQTSADLRTAFLAPVTIPATQSPTTVESLPIDSAAPSAGGDATNVQCKVGTLAPFATSGDKCKSIGGTQL